MFNINDKITFHLIAYTKDHKQLMPIYNIPKSIDMNFKLPEETAYVELKEYNEQMGIPSLTSIKCFHVGKGKKTNLADLLERGVLQDKSKAYKQDDEDLEVNFKGTYLIDVTDNEIIVRRKLNPEDLVFSSVSELEQYIKRLTVAIDSFKQEEAAVKRILKPE